MKFPLLFSYFSSNESTNNLLLELVVLNLGDVWKPLRKIDCKALNESRGKFHLFNENASTVHSLF